MTKPYLSLCMIVRNESKNLARCLDSVQGIVDEIVIVDTGSQDNTKEIALSYGAMVYDYEWHDDFAAARNQANSYANGEWILSLDADEEVVLQEDLRVHLKAQRASILCNTLYRYQTRVDSDELIREGYYFRLFRRDPKLGFKGRLHEQLFYEARPFLEPEIDFFNQEKGFVKHYGDADGNSLRKCNEFYIPMLERISAQEPLDLMLLGYLSDYYESVGELEKSSECYEQAMERLMPSLLTGDRPLDFLFVPSWLTRLCDRYFQQKDIETLFIILPNALKWCNKFPAIFNLAGKIFSFLEFDLAAIAYFQTAIDLCVNGTNQSSAIFEANVTPLEFIVSESLYLQGCCHINLQEWQKAIAALEQNISASEDFADPRFGDARQKIEWIQKEWIQKEMPENLKSQSEAQHENHINHQSLAQITDSEINIIQRFISSGNVVVDVGANMGNWSEQVLLHHANIEAHLFEAIPQTYYTLVQNFAGNLKQGNIFLNNIALSKDEKIQEYFFYPQDSGLSTMYRRKSVEQQLNLNTPTRLSLATTTLDQYCQQRNIHHLHFLKIDVEGAELDVLLGASRLLKSGSIDIVQFEYGGTYQDAGTTLRQVYELLEEYNYFIFKIEPDDLEFMPIFSLDYEDYQYSNFLAINTRICPLLMGEEPTMLDLNELCAKHQVEPRGVIHIGAHEGQEIDEYLAMNVKKMLLIEANPEVYARLQEKLANYENQFISSVNCAINHYDGEALLRITSADQSSSLLPLKVHSQIYPQITEERQIKVQSKTLDTLVKEKSLDLTEYNLLNIDIQGAELMALQGASETLRFMDAINIEVNYAELYEGCVLVHDLDDFLSVYGFERVSTTSPYHSSWGDAFYVKKPIVTMSTIGENGRFANQIFQYAFLKIYAKNHNLRIATSSWIGQTLFGLHDPDIRHEAYQFPIVTDLDNSDEEMAIALLPNSDPLYLNVDFVGYFQYHTKYYSAYKDLWRSLFQPIPEIASQMELALDRLRSFGKTIVGIHLRRGDYGHGIFFNAPTQWYRDWLEGFWDTLEDPVLFIASDDIDNVIGDFIDYMPITSHDLEIDMQLADFYTDFYLLSHCDAMAISNSSFSFAACMLNEVSKFFFRPHLLSQKLIPFDPWNSEVLLKHKVEDQESPCDVNHSL